MLVQLPSTADAKYPIVLRIVAFTIRDREIRFPRGRAAF